MVATELSHQLRRIGISEKNDERGSLATLGIWILKGYASLDRSTCGIRRLLTMTD